MILLVDNAYVYKDESGCYYSDGLYNNSFFLRYTSVFGRIRFIAKVKAVFDKCDAQEREIIDTENVEIIELPDFSGVIGLIKNAYRVFRAIQYASEGCNAFILRMLQLEGLMCWFQKKGRPYAVEVVNNVKTSTRYKGIVRLALIGMQKRVINRADAVSYVTEKTLQNDFPYRGKGIQTYYSSVEIPDDMIMLPKDYADKIDKRIKLIHVSNVIQGNSKGHFTILEILNRLECVGVEATCCFVGDGPSVDKLKEKAKDMGIKDRVSFVGYIPKKTELFAMMRTSDLFIFPSKSEGMPRCIIEACAVGLPCLANNVGGISEILPPKYLFRQDDIEGYVETLKRLANATFELIEMSKENLKAVEKYKASTLNGKRYSFYLSFRRMIFEE